MPKMMPNQSEYTTEELEILQNLISAACEAEEIMCIDFLDSLVEYGEMNERSVD